MHGLNLYSLLIGRPLLLERTALESYLEILDKKVRGDKIESLAASEAPPLSGTDRTEFRNGIAVIPFTGPVSRYSNMMTAYCGATSLATLSTDFNQAMIDPKVRGIVFEMDSPGGEVTGIAEFARMIFDARGTKPIVAYVGGSAASACYWIASACDEIVANSTSRLGSIGTILELALDDPKDAASRKTFTSTQSPLKNPDPTSEEGKSEYQTMVDEITSVFLEEVGTFRGIAPERVAKEYGRGGTMIGRAAVKAGLADRLGSFEKILAEMSAGEYRSPRSAAKPSNTGAKSMAMKWFMGKTDENGEVTALTEAEPPKSSFEPAKFQVLETHDAEKEAMKAEIAGLKAEKKAEAEARFKSEGASFAKVLKAERRILPAEESHWAGLFTQLAMDDHASPIAGSPNGRVDLLRAAAGAKAANRLTEERVGVLSDDDEDAEDEIPVNSRILNQRGRVERDEDDDDDEKPLSKKKLDELLSISAKTRGPLDYKRKSAVQD